MIKLGYALTRTCLRTFALLCTLCMHGLADEPSMVSVHAQLTSAGQGGVKFRIAPDLGHDEAFRVLKQGDSITVEHQAPAGALYGAQAVIRGDFTSGELETPDFQIRGTTLPMFKEFVPSAERMKLKNLGQRKSMPVIPPPTSSC